MPGTSPETDLYALTDDELSLGRPAVEVAKALLDSGIKILQYREKEKKAGQMFKECLELRRLTREAGACFIVNDHVDIAVSVKPTACTSAKRISPSRPCAVSLART